MRKHRIHLLGTMALALSIFAGCSSDGQGEIRVMLTDAPSDMFESAEVVISRVYLVPGPSGGGKLDILEEGEGPLTYDLLTLRDGIEARLGELSVPAGNYAQLRLVVDESTVVLVDGYQFEDGTMTRDFKIPSGNETGIKVLLSGTVTVEEGRVTVVVVDFDVNDSFVVKTVSADPTVISEVLFTPTLTENSRSSESME